jgi:hypothetical protein
MRRMNWRIISFALTLCLANGSIAHSAEKGQHIALKNDYVQRELEFDGHVWRTTRFARGDGNDALPVNSDEFHALFLDDTEVTLDAYEAAAEPLIERTENQQRITIKYVPRQGAQLSPHAPSAVTITYKLRNEPYLRKTVELAMKEVAAIDRLEVERFSTNTKQSRGGRGEPVFVDNTWFFGLEYPAFYSRHTDGNTPATYSGPYDRLGNYSFIDLAGRDVDRHPRPGLIRLMHFPGYAKKSPGDQWSIASKTAVAGVGHKGDTIELAFLDYLNTVRRPVRSFTHYNNYFSREGRDISIKNLVNNFYRRFKENLDPYGVQIDAMVVDDGWQDPKSIYDPNPAKFKSGMDDVAALSKALEQAGTHLGLWIALNGYNSSIDWGKENGYLEAERNKHFSRFKRYYSITFPKYNEKLRERIADLIDRCNVQYFKHDFNEMCDIGEGRGHLATDRHGHEASVDAELDLLALERQHNKNIYQNITNWIWFSPWWLAHGNNLWMLSNDSGEFRALPELSLLVMASAYRDVNLYTAWHDPATRPLVPISHLMTHGIIYTDTKYSDSTETLRDFADYVMMYYMRGLQLKEWYINPRVLSAPQWEALGRATRWSQQNVNTLANAVFVGDDPGKGETYGYICWNADQGILSVRNPSPAEAEITIPFDQSVWYRGAPDREFQADVVYPYQSPWPATFRSGQPIRLTVPGYSLMVFHLRPGRALQAPEPKLSAIEHDAATKDKQTVAHCSIPDERMQRCDLLLISRQGEPKLTIDGQPQKPSRTSQGKGWQMSAFDLSAHRGKKIEIAARPATDSKDAAADLKCEAWLIIDRPVAAPPADDDPRLPAPVSNNFRRQTLRLFENPSREP